MITLEINGQSVQAESGMSIIEAADQAGIHIPRFCYHRELSVAANCRMCLVEVEKSRKPLPACATPVTDDMRVFTQSSLAVAAQRSVMEYLLINHPLDCPVCDQGGECALQDTSMGYGSGYSHYSDGKRSVFKADIGPLIDTGMTRCIHCTRCVRFGEEVAGLRELGMCNRGEHAEIGTYVKQFIHSEVSGNVIDLCPVGALTSKPFRYQCRSWELFEKPGVAAHDAWGSTIDWHVRKSDLAENCRVMRVVPRDADPLRHDWLSDRDRFSYEGFDHKERLASPKVSAAGQWRDVSWQQSVPDFLDKLQYIIQQHGADDVVVLVSPNVSVEAGFMIQRVMRELGVSHIDHRLRISDACDQENQPVMLGLDMTRPDLQASDAFLIVGADLRREHPVASLSVRQAVLEGASAYLLQSFSRPQYIPMTAITQSPQVWSQVLLSMIADAHSKGVALPQGFSLPADVVSADATQSACVDSLLAGKQAVIWLGLQAYQHPHASLLRFYARVLSQMCDAKLALMSDGANSAGLSLAGVLPHREAFSQAAPSVVSTLPARFDEPKRAYLLFDIDPDHDFAAAGQAFQALSQAELVVAFSSFTSDTLHQLAHYLLPTTVVSEEAGSFINMRAQWQHYAPATPAFGQARPIWKIMRLIGQLANLSKCDYGDVHAIGRLIKAKCPSADRAFVWGDDLTSMPTLPTWPVDRLMRIGYWPLYRVDAVTRRAKSLQETHALLNPQISAAKMHPKTAAQYGLVDRATVRFKQNNESREFTILFDDRMSEQCVRLASAENVTASWGDAYAAITIDQEATDVG